MPRCSKMRIPTLTASLTLLALAAPGAALAGDAVVPPLVAKGVDPLVNLNLTSLISSEADFLGEWDMVNQLEEAPKGLTDACLGSTSCLGGIARANSADAVIAGKVVPGGGEYDFTLVYFDATRSRIVRTQTFTLPDSPADIADGMGPNVRELVTGEKPAAPEEDTLSGFEDVDLFEDDFSDDSSISRRIPTGGSGPRELTDGPEAEEAARRQAEEEARRQAEAEARRKAEEEARRRAEEEARRKAEEEARRRAEEEARRRAEEEARRQAEAAAAAAAAEDDDEEDFEDFELFSSTSVVAEETEEDPLDDPLADLDDLDDDRSSSRRSSSRSSSRYDDLDDLDDDRSSSSRDRVRSEREPRERTSREPSEVEDRALMVAARVGYAPFQGLGFISYGGEVNYKVAGGLAVGGGIEAWAVQREIPAEFLQPGEPVQQWNTILPINVGAQYHLGSGMAQPYLGGDLVLIPGLVRDEGGVATGVRARAGANFVVADGLALNLNAAVGYLGAGQFESVADGMSSGGLSPQLSAGTVLRF